LADSDIRILCLEIALADNHVLARLPVAWSICEHCSITHFS
jgi:hypothetical protein